MSTQQTATQTENLPSIPQAKGDSFIAIAQGACDYSVEVIPVGREDEKFGQMMCLCTQEGAIYITKEQAKAFFGL